jgi:MATE family multidrug resistance protein
MDSVETTTQRIRREAFVTLRLGLPLILAQVMQMSMGFVDTIMAGNLNAAALAAVAVGGSLYMPLLIFVLGILLVINPIVAQFFGAGRDDRVGEELWQVLWLALMLAVPGFFILRNLNFVMVLFGIHPDVIPIAQGYLEALSWGLPAAFCYFALRYVNEGLHVTKPSMYIALVGVGFNIAGNTVFMYGHLGFPAMGAVGTGWATTLVQWTMLTCMLLYTFRKETIERFKVRQGFRWPTGAFLREILRIGVPNGFSLGIEVTMFAVAALIIGSMGLNEVAAHQVTINFAAFTFMVPLGLSFAISARVGYAIGRQSVTDARFLGFIGITLAACFMCIAAIIMFSIPELIIGIYTSEIAVAEIAVNLLFYAALFQISDGLQVSGLAALRGLKDTRIPMLVNFIAYWVVGLPSGYLLGMTFGYGPKGLWIGMILGLSVAAVLHNLRFLHLTRLTTG